jgi:glycosyltransferase involved in cell wall biosynthesis
MKILIVSDAWHPQINGVVRTLEMTVRELEKLGHKVAVAGPDGARRWTLSMPFYPDIPLEFFAGKRLGHLLDEFRPDFIHIATEGPLGWTARNLCMQRQRPFTTSFHTRFPEYLAARLPRGLASGVGLLAYAALRRFHAPSSAILVATHSMEKELRARKFHRLVRWSRGVDTDLFRPREKDPSIYAGLARPILLCVGRIATEKNLRAFLDIEAPGSKILIGDGPALPRLRADYPEVHFPGLLEGEALARHYAAADLFVFPSKTETFGLVLLEACASGLRVASVPAPGPSDIFADPVAHKFAVLDEDLGRAVARALALSNNPVAPRTFAEGFSWATCTRQFFDHLQASTPKAVRRITRLRLWLGRRWQHALALAFK